MSDGNSFPAGCGLEGAADCVGLDGESCWHGVNVTANVNPAILDSVIVRLKQMLPCKLTAPFDLLSMQCLILLILDV